ncbi:MAG: type VI secretion system tip protein VgrG [Burkholderiales bacterium]|nr:type VI secretion system tip protein VgrG [Burkholderiales bacterium]
MNEPIGARRGPAGDWHAVLRGLLDDATRLYRLEGDGELAGLWVECWHAHEALDEPGDLHIHALSDDAHRDPHAMLGQRVTLWTRLADGSEHPRVGLVTEASAEASDGGLARYSLRVQPWLALLAHSRRSQVWQDASVQQIAESVFSAYPQAAWCWADCVAPHLADSHGGGVRPYTVQYRETDLDFITRLFRREGLVMRLERHAEAPTGHRLVILADSVGTASCPEDPTSASAVGGPGVRFHASGAVQAQDAVQALGGHRRLPLAACTAVGYDLVNQRVVAASVPTAFAFGSAAAPWLNDHDDAGADAFADAAQLERSLRLQQQAHEARHKTWFGRSTVRTFTAGHSFTLTDSELDAADLHGWLGEGAASPARAHRFLLTRVTHAGINNLPRALGQQLARELGQPAWPAAAVPDAVRAQAAATGYGNAFEAIRAEVPWRPAVRDAQGQRLPWRAEAPGMLTATVVTADGSAQAAGTGAIHCDRLGRIRIRFDFQCLPQGPGTSASSVWVPVLQRWAGPGVGMQFLPRVGQEVLVDFFDADMAHPVVVGALYNGQGEAGEPPTPGGAPARADRSALAASTDHRAAAQGNLVAGGHSPAWHGAGAADLAAGGQRNAAALSGIKTREFGGTGHNQLVFDDSDGQLRTQLATTQHATQLNLGHLVDPAVNPRGSFRGLGFELRTDAYGAVRAGRGVLLSTYATSPAEPAGDNAAGIALQRQWVTLAQAFARAAITHQTAALADHTGSHRAGASALSPTEPPAAALLTALQGMVDAGRLDAAVSDAAQRRTAVGDDAVPHTGAPVVQMVGRAGLATVAGQDICWSAGEGIAIASGDSTELVAGGAVRIHTGQSIGLLGGAIQPGADAAGTGLTMVAAGGDLQLQAQAGPLQLAARGDVHIDSRSAHIDWAAATRIVLQTAAGASVTLEGGNITIECPGKLTVQASQKSFEGAASRSYAMPALPRSDWRPGADFPFSA